LHRCSITPVEPDTNIAMLDAPACPAVVGAAAGAALAVMVRSVIATCVTLVSVSATPAVDGARVVASPV
jgi:hypothetical protein